MAHNISGTCAACGTTSDERTDEQEAAHENGLTAQRDAEWSRMTARAQTGADLRDYRTGERIRTATATEEKASREQAGRDGGAGVIEVDGRPCYVDG